LFEHHKKQHLTSLPQQSSTRFEQLMHMLQQPIQQNQSWSKKVAKKVYACIMENQCKIVWLMFGTYAMS
jgi:predicted RNA-binding protein with RPS1 domain